MVELTIDNKKVAVKKDCTVLEAAREARIDIPTLCYLKDINEVGDCRMCVVEIENKRGMIPSCVQKVEDGMVVHTNTDQVVESRRMMLDLIISNHDQDCLTCTRSGNCELQELAKKFNLKDIRFSGEKNKFEIDDLSPSVIRDFNKCILCRRCVATCNNVQGIGTLATVNRGFNSCISTIENRSLNDVNCTFCGQCIKSCPTGALREKDTIDEVMEKIKDPNTLVYVQTAPSIRVALGEEFGMKIGSNVTGKMVTALKEVGFDLVFDTNVGADFTIMEEATELVDRIKNNGVLPMFTSCSPAWVRYIEMNYPELLPHVSTCKSPHQMLGALIKTYYAEKKKIDPKKIYNVSIMPCTSKKFESSRKEMAVDGLKDVDNVLTTRELARMIKQCNIDFMELGDSEFDNPLEEATGAGAIFGTTGGVMEAALRTAQELLGDRTSDIIFKDVRGGKGIKRATVTVKKKEINVVVASGLKNAQEMMEEVKNGTSDLHFIEIMACPGGCIMGGGQPIVSAKKRMSCDVRKLRADSLYTIDEKSAVRKSHENPILRKIYREYVGKPGEEKAHKLLHTHNKKRSKYNLK